MIEGFRKNKTPFLVSQTFKDGLIDESKKIPIVLTDYGTEQAAKVHFDSINDQYKAILNLENEKHRNKIIEMLQENSRFKLYVAIVADMNQVKRRLNLKYTNNIKSFISRRTKWRIEPKTTVYPDLEISFGELFVVLKYGSYKAERVKLSELEKF